MNILGYELVTSIGTDIDYARQNIKQKVEYLLKDDWKPLGDIHFNYTHDGKFVFAQALAKYGI